MIPNVEIVRTGLHEDITLEDFWVRVNVNGNVEQLAFLNANIRSLESLRGEYQHLMNDAQ